jgi:hypothetical protein
VSARVFALWPLLLVLSCASNPPPPAKEPPQISWSGTWIRLDGLAVPKEKKVSLQDSCMRSAEHWTIEQKDNSVLLDYHAGELTAEARMTLVSRKIEKAKGERRKSFVRLDGESGVHEAGPNSEEALNRRSKRFPVMYELEWDPKTEHLSGTRNGTPVRFVRAEVLPADKRNCPPAP